MLALLAKAGLPGGDASALGPTGEAILFSVRLPRVLLAALVGGGLAVVGAVLQAVFRNPLADAGLLGIGSGAALGAVLAVNLGLSTAVFFALPLAAFAGAMAAMLAVYLIAGASGRTGLAGLLLTGIAVSALAGAGTSVLLVATEEFRVKTVLFWLAGGLDGRGWTHVQAGAAFVLTGVALLGWLGRPFDVLSLGEEEAASLGLPVRATRLAVCWASPPSWPEPALQWPDRCPSSASWPRTPCVPSWVPSVATSCPRPSWAGRFWSCSRTSCARTLSARLELPLGALTALLGAPYFLVALRANEGRG